MKNIYFILVFIFFLLAGIKSISGQSLSIDNTSTINENITGYVGTSGSLPNYWYQQGTGTNGTNQAGTNQTGGTTGGWYGGTGMSFLGSGTASNGNATLILRNNTGNTITGFTLSFTARMWRSQSNSPTVSVSWNSGSSVSNPPQGTLANSLNSLGFSDATPNISTGTILTQTVTGQNINNGDYIYIRWIHTGGTNSDNLGWSNIKFTASTVASHTISAPTINTAPFTLTTCSSTATGTVDFTSVGSFTGNTYTAQLSDASGNFSSPTNIGTLSSNLNSGTINITIPSGTANGTGYKIRVISSSPSITGTESSAFTINAPSCVSNTSDYFRSKQTGNWNNTSTWESSVDNITWIDATLIPDNNANIIKIRNGHQITISSNRTLDQTIIENGGSILHSGGTLTIANGIGDDMSIENGGIFISDGTLANFSGSAILRVKTNGIIRSISGSDGARYAASGLTSPASVTDNVIWEHGSIYEYTQTLIFGSSGVIYFPNVTSEIPIFRVTNNVGAVGANTNTIINGIFEINGSITFQNTGTKTFRNGIRGSGTITQSSNSGTFIINGINSVLGGNIILNTNGLTQSGNTTLVSNLSLTGGKLTVNGNINLAGFDMNLGTTGSIQEDIANNKIITDLTATNETSKGGAIKCSSVNITNTTTEIRGIGLYLQKTLGMDYTINVERYHYRGASNGIKKIYAITGGDPAGTNSIMRIYYASNELAGLTGVLRLFRWQNITGWKQASDPGSGFSNGINGVDYVEATNINQFSHWTIGSESTPLPISLLSFNVFQINENQSKITWQTATEINNKHFEIWKSENGFEYQQIHTQDAQLNSNQMKNYDFIDNQFSKSAYYQLKQIDTDGKINELGIRFLNKKEETNIEIYPNPFSDNLFLKTNKDIINITIYNQLGQQIGEVSGENIEFLLKKQFTQLNKGIYWVEFKTTTQKRTQKVYKM